MTRVTLAALACALCCALPLWAQLPDGDAALRAKLPEGCEKGKAPDPPKVKRHDVLPSAKEIAESYGLLSGPLASFLDEAGETDLVFETDLCQKREWDDKASGIEFEVTEYLLCHEVIEVEVRHRAPVNPIAGLLDVAVAKVFYSWDGGEIEISSREELREIFHLLRTQSRNNAVLSATRPRRGSDGKVVPSETGKSSPNEELPTGLLLLLKDGQTRRFPGRASSGQFAGFSNGSLYLFFSEIAKQRGISPPKE